MLEKIIEISNLGHFVNFRFSGTKDWNGQLKKLNIVYAPNGSGKTTLSTILKSLSKNDLDLIKFKKTFGSTIESKVIVKEYGNGTPIQFNGSIWTSNNLKIEVFDINYIEEYLFVGSFSRKQNKTSLFKLLLEDEGNNYKAILKPLIHRKEELTKLLSVNKSDIILKEKLDKCGLELNNKLIEYKNFSDPIFNKHVEVVNKYLSKFTSYITLTGFSFAENLSEFETFRITPTFKVYEEKVEFSAPNPSKNIGNARYAMSEGDKSTIALCFFLARLEIQGVSDKIIVFDDPLSSFDYSRRNSTIYHLAKVAKNAVQFILLTHDLAFASDFTEKCSPFIESINLKIENNGYTSYVAYHDINSEFLTSTQKDLEVIKNYLKKSNIGEVEKREVIRCIRPALEGIFKTKYFDIIPNNKWLGDIIELIRASATNSRLYKLNLIADDIIELNDYTKRFHHSSGNQSYEQINSAELSRYINLLMLTIDKI